MKKKKKNSEDTQQLLETIVEGILDKKGNNIAILKLAAIDNSVCDYFVICDADSNRQVDAITFNVEKMAKEKLNEKVVRIEGLENSQWVLMDYFSIIVHVFQKQYRTFYNLEALWADSEITYIKEGHKSDKEAKKARSKKTTIEEDLKPEKETKKSRSKKITIDEDLETEKETKKSRSKKITIENDPKPVKEVKKTRSKKTTK